SRRYGLYSIFILNDGIILFYRILIYGKFIFHKLFLEKLCRIICPGAAAYRTMERNQPYFSIKRQNKSGDVAIAQKHFRITANQLVVDVRKQSGSTITSSDTKYSLHLIVGKHTM